MNEKFFLAVDGGGTKTDFVLFSIDGTVVESFRAGTGNPAVAGLDNVYKMLSDGVRRCLAYTKKIESVFIGIAGGKHTYLAEELAKEFPQIRFFADNDAVNVMEDNDIGLICGTGSIIVLREQTGCKTVGGWGYTIGDPASAYNFGKEAVRASLEMEAMIGVPTKLYDFVREVIKVPDGEKLYDYFGPFCRASVKNVASLSPIVFSCAKEGDKVSQSIIENEVRLLIEMLNATMMTYKGERTVSIGGGVASNNRETMLPLMEKYAKKDIKFEFSDLPPVFGACLECLKRNGLEKSGGFRERFCETYIK